VAIACNEIQVVDNDTTLLNPIVIFEVLSKSTEQRDRSEKLEDYFNLESVKDYILVSQNRVKVEHFHRENNGKWSLQILTELENTLVLESIECEISLRLIYLKLKLPTLNLYSTMV
jgi:Uma2 family endonuclease